MPRDKRGRGLPEIRKLADWLVFGLKAVTIGDVETMSLPTLMDWGLRAGEWHKKYGKRGS